MSPAPKASCSCNAVEGEPHTFDASNVPCPLRPAKVAVRQEA